MDSRIAKSQEPRIEKAVDLEIEALEIEDLETSVLETEVLEILVLGQDNQEKNVKLFARTVRKNVKFIRS